MKKSVAIVIVSIFVMGFIIGLYQTFDLSLVIGVSFSFKYFWYLLFVILLAVALSFLGLPIFLLLLILDIFNSGLVTAFFLQNFHLPGMIFCLIFLVVFKIGYWFLLLLNGFYSLKLIKNNYIYFFYRYLANKNNSKLYLKKMGIISSAILIFIFLTVSLGDKVIIPLANYLLF